MSGLSLDERSAVEKAIKLLSVARNSGSEAERLAAYNKARDLLARLDKAGLHLPKRAQAAFDDEARTALPTARRDPMPGAQDRDGLDPSSQA